MEGEKVYFGSQSRGTTHHNISMVAGWWQECDAPSHTAGAVRKQGADAGHGLGYSPQVLLVPTDLPLPALVLTPRILQPPQLPVGDLHEPIQIIPV